MKMNYKEARQARDYCVATNALRRASLAQGKLAFAHPITPKAGVLGTPVRAARPDPSLRKERWLGMTNIVP